jgi:hypothetical protein
MATSVSVIEFWDDSKRIHVVGQITFSGNYATGGDSVTLTGLYPGQRTAARIVAINNISGYTYRYDHANSRIRVYQAPSTGSNPLSEISAAAYPSGVTGDTVIFYAIGRK